MLYGLCYDLVFLSADSMVRHNAMEDIWRHNLCVGIIDVAGVAGTTNIKSRVYIQQQIRCAQPASHTHTHAHTHAHTHTQHAISRHPL